MVLKLLVIPYSSLVERRLYPLTRAFLPLLSIDRSGTSGYPLCIRMWSRFHFCFFPPQIVGNWAGPSGEERVADSGSQFRTCDDEHKRIQASNCDSDIPKEVHIFVKRGSRFLSICLFGFNSAWCTGVRLVIQNRERGWPHYSLYLFFPPS